VVLARPRLVFAAFERAAPRMALCLGACVALLLAGAPPLAASAHQLSIGLTFLVVFVPFMAVGVLLAFRLPRNPIGWIFLVLSFGVVLGTDAGAYALRAYRIDQHGLPLSRLAVAVATGWIAFVLLPLPILLFPDGQVGGRGWRWTLRLYLAVAAMFAAAIGAHDIHAFTDRTVNRARYDKEAILTAFSGRLRRTVDLMTIEEELLEAVNVSLAPGHTSLWIKPPA
jgi:hypothetical protein